MANQKDNSGALFKESEKHPDYKGNCMVNGEVMYLAAWINTPKAGGNKYMSLTFTPQTEQAKYSKADADGTAPPVFEEGDVPF